MKKAAFVFALPILALLGAGANAGGGGGGHDAPKDGGKDGHKAAPAKPAPPPPPTPAAAAAPEAEQPWRLIRALHRLQARLGEGDATAQAAQGDLVADLAKRFDAAPAPVWDDRRNAAAQMVLLLSGADPRTARKRLEDGLFGSHDGPPRVGLAFADGDLAGAAQLLGDLDADFDDLAGAHAALAAATAAAAGPPEERGKAHALFDRARLLAPGFLPEEAALRRQTRLAEDLGERARFAELAARYLRRYAASVYAPPFRARLARATAALAISTEALAAMTPLIVAFNAQERAAALDAVARAALSQGKPELTQAAASLWLDAGADEAGRGRAKIYALAAQALRGSPDVAARLAETRVGDPDAEALRRAALDLARQVNAWPPTPPKGGSAPEASAPRAKDGAEAAAQKALAEGESLLRAAPTLATNASAPPAPRAAPSAPATQGTAR